MAKSKALNNVFKLNDIVSVKEPRFGAIGDGVTDDTAAIQAALNTGKPVYVPPGTYKITSTISIPNKATIIGNWSSAKDTGASHPIFSISAGITGFQTKSTASYEAVGLLLIGLSFLGGATQLDLPNGGVGLTIKDCLFTGPSGKCLSAAGFCQEWVFDGVEFSGGQYGLYMPAAVGSFDGATSLLDKSAFRRIYCHGQTINGIVTKFLLSNNVLWEQPTLVYIVQDGWLIDGGIRDWVIVNTNTEGAGGYLGSTPTAPTTGSITSGTPTLLVASGAGIVDGDTLTVKGAGISGADLYSSVVSGGGTVNIVLADNASTSVVSQEVTKYQYSDIKVTNAVATPAQITFIGGSYGITGSVFGARYAIDASGGTGFSFYGTRTGTRPIYDPNRAHSFSGGTSCLVRSLENFLNETFSASQILSSGDGHRSQTVTPNGGRYVIGLRDSAGNGSGSYGDFEVRKYNANRTRILYLSGNTGSAMNLAGPISPGGFGAGTGALSSIAATELRICFGNAAPTAGTWTTGDRVKNQTPAIGQPKGWVCTVTGTPGTWVSEGNL